MAVKQVIHAIWQVDHFVPYSKEYIIPKGVIEIIFNFSDSSVILNKADSSAYHLPHCFINGFNRAPLELQLPRQLVFFGVQFQPMAVKKIFGCPASEFADITVDLALVDPAFISLWYQLAEQGDFHKRVTVFNAWLKQHFTDPQPREQLINDFLYNGDQHDLSVKELADTLCYSSRHLSRRLFDATGMNTEELLLYKKYLHAVHLIHHTELPLTDVAYQSRFADQSHFIKSFKAYTKMTPGAYKRNKSIVKGHLYKDVR